MQRFHRFLAAAMAAFLLAACFGLGVSAEAGFTITNPYAGVDWGACRPCST